MSWGLARVVVPVLFLGAVFAAALVRALPPAGNDALGVAIAALFGTLLMVPTWTEIAIASGFIQNGATGPAAALLLTLPAVSLPCLVVVTGAVGSGRVALLLALAVGLVGLGAGLLFL